MRARLVPASVLLLAVGAASQQRKIPAPTAHCRFSNGSTIAVTYSSDLRGYRFVTDGSLLAVNGVHVPAGEYVVTFPRKDSADNWTLMLKTPSMKTGVQALPPLPMTVASSSPSAGTPTTGFPVFFDHTGGSCMLHWSEKLAEEVLSLEFTQENTDLPVVN
jgi:hypothetical protein